MREQVSFHLAFRVQDARFEGARLRRFPNIVCQLPIEKTQTIGAADPQLHPR